MSAPNNTKPGELSFITHMEGPRGGWKKSDHFDAPAGKFFSEGMQYGMAAGEELLGWAKGGCKPYIAFQSVLMDASSRVTAPTQAERGAANAFLEVVEEAFKFAAKHGDFEAFFAQRRESNAHWVEMERGHEQDRIRRSAETRRIKRELKAKGGST